MTDTGEWGDELRVMSTAHPHEQVGAAEHRAEADTPHFWKSGDSRTNSALSCGRGRRIFTTCKAGGDLERNWEASESQKVVLLRG